MLSLEAQEDDVMVTFNFTVRGKKFSVSSNANNPYEIVNDVRGQIVNILSKEDATEPKLLHATIIEVFGQQYPLKGESEPLELGEFFEEPRPRRPLRNRDND